MVDREPIHIIYDGQCTFCIRALRIVKALDVWRVLRFHDGRDRASVEARFPALRGADLDAAMFAIAEPGRTYRGFFAFRRVAWGSPLTWPFLPLFYFPGARWLGPVVYAWVARNRSSLGCRAPVDPAPPPAGTEPPPTDRGRVRSGGL